MVRMSDTLDEVARVAAMLIQDMRQAAETPP
jgi:hypothetical protein